MPATTPPQQIGRFKLLAPLGQGAQAVVWCAFDPNLQREVALKVFRSDLPASEVDAWLREARLMARLNHPGIVAVHDVGRDGAQPFVVLERVKGRTLTEHLQQHGALAPREAVALMLPVLEALAFAHRHGIVHRDLKLSNVLLGEDGRPRVMDFGIAGRMAQDHDGSIVGTPSTISPEAAQGLAPTPAMDVYSAGMVLGHLLCGQPLRQERDPWRAIQSAIHDDITWPSPDQGGTAQAVDDGLRSLVLRAVARDPSVRFADAAALGAALTRWMEPEPAPLQDAQHSTLHFLLRRMRLHGDFPALSDSVMRIQRIVGSDAGSLGALSDEIMKDVALTHKLLRLVNTVQFRRANAAEVTSVARAAALVGFAAIRNMALSVMLLEHMQDKAQAERMRSLFLRALLTAALCDELTPIGPEREESFLAGLLSHLGRLLVQYYLPEEAKQIDARVQASGQSASASVDSAARAVLGLSLHELAHGVAQAWQLPPSLLEAMSLPTGEVPKRALQTTPERLRWRTRLAHDMVDTLLSQEPEAAASEIARLAQSYARALGLSADQIQAAVQVARAQLVSLAASLHLPLGQGPLDRRLSGLASPKRPAPHDPELAQQQLEQSIEQVTDALAADSFRLNDVLLMVLQGLQQALDACTVVLALRDPATGSLLGRLAVGEEADHLRAQCRVELRSGLAADLLAAVCIKGKDTLISDAQASTLAPRLPAWLREHTPRSFLLLPLLRQGVPFALIYVAYDGEEALTLSDRELGLVRTLRNQALMAFKTAA